MLLFRVWNVGALRFYFAQMGAKVVGIIDAAGGLIKDEGFSFDEIKTLYKNKKGNSLVSENMMPSKSTIRYGILKWMYLPYVQLRA